MNLSELSLRRPVLAIVCSIVIIIFGGIGYKYLGIREYPAIDPAVVNVRTSYVGANSDIIEHQYPAAGYQVPGKLCPEHHSRLFQDLHSVQIQQ